MLNRLLDGFEGKLTSSKWAALAKCSADTALRDINALVEAGVLRRAEGGGEVPGMNCRADGAEVASRCAARLRVESTFLEVVGVDPLDDIRGRWRDTDIKVNHQTCKLPAVDEYDLGIYSGCVVHSLIGVDGRGDEHTFLRSLALQGTDKFLDLGTPD